MSKISLNVVDDNNNSSSATLVDVGTKAKSHRVIQVVGNKIQMSSMFETETNNKSTVEGNLFLEEVYYTPSTSSALSPADPWTADLEFKSLVVAEVGEAGKLRDLINQVVLEHEVLCSPHEDTFEACNNNVFQLIWMKMTVPANQEILSLSTSIRYASKSNRGTVILGLADTQPDVDLRLHGIDEVLVGTLSKSIIRQKYVKWTSLQTIHAEDPNLMDECPKTPSSPSSVCSDTMSTTTLNSSQDLSLNSHESVNDVAPKINATSGSTVLSSLRNFNLQTAEIQPRVAKTAISSASDHTTKEKLRRERIKDSCDQLRVLLPYIRGRKTDMASILEMTVDYLKIISTAIPQDFQNQVVSIMSKGPVLPKVKAEGARSTGRRSGRREPDPPESPSTTRVSSTVDSSCREGSIVQAAGMFDASPSSMSTPTRTSQSQLIMSTGTKRESSDSFKDAKPASKRIHLPTHPMTSPNTSQPGQGIIYIQPEADTRTDPSDLSRDSGSPIHIQGVHIQPHLYGDLDANANRRYPNTFLAPDAYPLTNAAVNGTSTRVSNIDRDAYGMYVENAFYQYYTGQQNTTFSTGAISDYVNPNAVLPVAYSSRMVGNRNYDESDRFGATDNM